MSEIKKTSLFESIVSTLRITTAIFIIVVIEIIRYIWVLLPIVFYTLNKIVPISTLCLNITNNIKILLLSIKSKVIALLLYYPYCVYECVNDYVTDIILFDKIETQRMELTGKIKKTNIFEMILLFTIMITPIITIGVISIVKYMSTIIIYLVLCAILITKILIIDLIKFVNYVYMTLMPMINHQYFVLLRDDAYWKYECVKYYVNNIILFNSNEIKYVNKFKQEKVVLQQSNNSYLFYDCLHVNNFTRVQYKDNCKSEIFYDCENNHKCHISIINIQKLNKKIQEQLNRKYENKMLYIDNIMQKIRCPTQDEINNIIAMHKYKQVYPDIKAGIEARYAKKSQKAFTAKISGDLAKISHYKTRKSLMGERIKEDLIVHNLNMNKIVVDHDKIQIENTQKKLQEIAKNNMKQQKKIIDDIDKQLEQRNIVFERQMAELDKDIEIIRNMCNTNTSG